MLILRFLLYASLGFLYLSCPINSTGQGKKYFNCYQSSTLYPLNNEIKVKDTVMFKYLLETKAKMENLMNETIVYVDMPLTKAQPESTLGNWITDAVKKSLQKDNQKIDACILNYGCINKEYIAPGPMKRKDIYELITTDNKIVLVSLDGQSLEYLCDSIAQSNGLPVSGLSFKIANHKASGIFINHQPLNKHLIYTIAMNNHLWQNKRLSSIFVHATYKNAFIDIKNLLLDYALLMQQRNERITMKLENRIQYAE